MFQNFSRWPFSVRVCHCIVVRAGEVKREELFPNNDNPWSMWVKTEEQSFVKKPPKMEFNTWFWARIFWHRWGHAAPLHGFCSVPWQWNRWRWRRSSARAGPGARWAPAGRRRAARPSPRCWRPSTPGCRSPSRSWVCSWRRSSPPTPSRPSPAMAKQYNLKQCRQLPCTHCWVPPAAVAIYQSYRGEFFTRHSYNEWKVCIVINCAKIKHATLEVSINLIDR